jgi:hypothetical protein
VPSSRFLRPMRLVSHHDYVGALFGDVLRHTLKQMDRRQNNAAIVTSELCFQIAFARSDMHVVGASGIELAVHLIAQLFPVHQQE